MSECGLLAGWLACWLAGWTHCIQALQGSVLSLPRNCIQGSKSILHMTHNCNVAIRLISKTSLMMQIANPSHAGHAAQSLSCIALDATWLYLPLVAGWTFFSKKYTMETLALLQVLLVNGTFHSHGTSGEEKPQPTSYACSGFGFSTRLLIQRKHARL